MWVGLGYQRQGPIFEPAKCTLTKIKKMYEKNNFNKNYKHSKEEGRESRDDSILCEK